MIAADEVVNEKSGLPADLERLRIAAGVELEDSFESGSKWQVGDKELAEIVRLAKIEERERCADECERMMRYPGAIQESPAYHTVWDAAKAIRALSD